MKPQYSLGRIQQFDVRSIDFNIRSLIPPEPNPITTVWDCSIYLDQGQVPSCVGNAHAYDLAGMPVPIENVTQETAMQIYTLAQTMDGIRGPHHGTSVLAGIKAVQERWPEAVGGYHWAFSVEDIISTLVHVGPMVFGLNWYNGMFYPDPSGEVFPVGNLQGGHAIWGHALDVERGGVWFLNSWGPEWGVNGRCFMSYKTLRDLMQEGGEAMVLTDRGVIYL